VNEGKLEPRWRMRARGPPLEQVINRLLTLVRRPSAAVLLGTCRCSSRRRDVTGANFHRGIRFHSMLPGNGEFFSEVTKMREMIVSEGLDFCAFLGGFRDVEAAMLAGYPHHAIVDQGI